MAQTKVAIFSISGRDAELNKLKELILKGGCLVVCEGLTPDAFEACLASADVLVILICSETCQDESVTEVVNLAAKQGMRVVGVWSQDADIDKLPQALHRLGDANIRLDQDEIAKTICGGETIWLTPGGTERPKPKTPRHSG